VDLTAVYPTLVDLAGLPAKEGLDGQSLRPLLENPSVALGRTALSTYLRGNHAVTGRRWRYIRYHDGSEELYDRLKDPQEWVNLAGGAGYAQHKQELARSLPPRDAPDAPRSQDYRLDTDKVLWLPKGARR
jgi:arylsulfatase A-like enzyme